MIPVENIVEECNSVTVVYFFVKGKEEREERERKGKVKGTEREMRWKEGFGSSKNVGVAPLCQTPIASSKGTRGV